MFEVAVVLVALDAQRGVQFAVSEGLACGFDASHTSEFPCEGVADEVHVEAGSDSCGDESDALEHPVSPAMHVLVGGLLLWVPRIHARRRIRDPLIIVPLGRVPPRNVGGSPANSRDSATDDGRAPKASLAPTSGAAMRFGPGVI